MPQRRCHRESGPVGRPHPRPLRVRYRLFPAAIRFLCQYIRRRTLRLRRAGQEREDKPIVSGHLLRVSASYYSMRRFEPTGKRGSVLLFFGGSCRTYWICSSRTSRVARDEGMRQAGEAGFTSSLRHNAGDRCLLCSSKCNMRAKMHRTNHCRGTPLFRDIVSDIVLRTIYLSYCPTNRLRQTSPALSSGEPEDRVRTDPCPCRTGRTQQEKEVRATPVCQGTEKQRTIFDQKKTPRCP